MKFFHLEPGMPGEIADGTEGDFRGYPTKITRLVYEMDSWLGDDLMEVAFDIGFLVTEPLKDALESVGASGCELDNVEFTLSQNYEFFAGQGELPRPDEWPKFYWMKVHGVAAVDDFARDAELDFVVSERVMEALRGFEMKFAEVREYVVEDSTGT